MFFCFLVLFGGSGVGCCYGKSMNLRMTVCFGWLYFVWYLDAFHLLHVGGPSHPSLQWEVDCGREWRFNLRFRNYIVNTYVFQHWDLRTSHVFAGLLSLNVLPHSYRFQYCETTMMLLSLVVLRCYIFKNCESVLSYS